jgi:hypothetical protein
LTGVTSDINAQVNGPRKIEPDDELVQAMSLPDWSPPDALGAQTLDPFRQRGRLWLATAVNIMAFGQPEAPDPERLIDIGRKQRAAKALFDAARWGQVSLVGDVRRGGDRSDQIPAAYFDTPRNLGRDDNSIETDLDLVSWSGFLSAREKEHVSWFNVRANGSEFIDWLAGTPTEAPVSREVALAEPRRKRSRPARGLAIRALEARFGEALPDDGQLPNKTLCDAVREWVSNQPPEDRRKLSDDTILRAAGRRK